jgi:predicted enzyme related to lactoylglutathione lyase
MSKLARVAATRRPPKEHPMPVQTEFLQDGRVIVVRISGTLSAQDYAEFTPLVEDAVADFGTVRLVVVMSEFHGWKMAAVWQDIKFEAKHYHHIERLAMVGDRAWERGMAAFCMPFTTADIRYFDASDEAEALTWAQETKAAQSSGDPNAKIDLDRISAVRVFVFDLAAARKFYAETLGLSILSDGEGYSTFALGDARLIVEVVQRSSEYALLVGRFSGISLGVDDIEQAYEDLQARGVSFLDPPEQQPWGGIVAHFEDSDENILTIVQYPET